jgi:Ca-activated chloride channel family protein
MNAARKATAAAVDALRDGALFAVVEGTHLARVVYPDRPELIAATPETRDAAKKVARHLEATGGTAMGQWLRLADELLASHPEAVRHVMLLTDGQNLPKHKADLDEALEVCAGRFVCDGRGIGDDYLPDELQRIVATLRGCADAILRDSDLVAEFTAMMRAAMGKVVPDVRLWIRPMPFARLRFLKQTFPSEVDLTVFGMPVDARTTAFSTGSWGEGEEREFHICLEVTRGDLDPHEDFQAARVDLAIPHAGDRPAEPYGRPQPIRVHWTADATMSSMMDPKVAHYTGHTELAEAMRAGRAALAEHDVHRAGKQWGRAVALAAGLGHQEMLIRLGRLVDIDGDPANGVVSVRPNLRPREIFSAMFESLKSTHSPDVRPDPATEEPATAPGRVCPNCQNEVRHTARFCSHCRHPLGETV